jgi:hypothetical protein
LAVDAECQLVPDAPSLLMIEESRCIRPKLSPIVEGFLRFHSNAAKHLRLEHCCFVGHFELVFQIEQPTLSTQISL